MKKTPRPLRALKPKPPEGPHRSGFALLLGRPNVGKSTLLNALTGEHLAIVSPHPQTTRGRILGIVNAPGTQLCLMDAPGVHRAKGLLNQAMVDAAMSAIEEVDVVLYLAEAGWPAKAKPEEKVDPVGPFHRELLAELKKSRKPVMLVLTKIDLIPKPLLLHVIQAWSQEFDFRAVYPVSAKSGDNVEGFVEVVRPFLPEGPPLYPEDTLTDQSERALCAEFIREQVFLETRDEIPFSTAVVIEAFDETERSEAKKGGGLARIAASIVLGRESHKAIVIGAKGERLKEIGSRARRRMETLLGCRVWLDLHVKAVPGWTERKSAIAEYGVRAK